MPALLLLLVLGFCLSAHPALAQIDGYPYASQTIQNTAIGAMTHLSVTRNPFDKSVAFAVA